MPNPETQKVVDSTSDRRVINNVMRHEYRVLSEAEKANMKAIKDVGAEFYRLIESLEDEHATPPELRIAKERVEEAVMWSVKHIAK